MNDCKNQSLYRALLAWTLTGAFIAISTAAHGQSTTNDNAALRGIRLPAELHGKWDYEGRVGNTWSLRLDRLHEDGRIEGRVTWWGTRCSVKDEAIIEGSLREGRLRVRAPTDNRYVCGDLIVDLRAGDKHLFEGEATSTIPVATVKAWLDRPR